jgi:actin-related protein 5
LEGHLSPRYPKDVQDTLVQNVFLTGGNVMYPGMKARIERELLQMRPFQSSFQVLLVNLPKFKNHMNCFLIAKIEK